MKLKIKLVNFGGIKGIALVDTSNPYKTNLLGGRLVIGVGLYRKGKATAVNTPTYRAIKIGRLSLEWDK